MQLRGVSKDLEVPFWARDPSEQGEDRKLDLPCFGNKLKGDYNPPFTCGSDTRRSIIKYFVRDEINANSEGNTLAEQLVRERIRQLKEAWKDVAQYACECTSASEVGVHGRHNLLCCKTFESASSGESCTCLDGETVGPACCEDGNNFLPKPLQILFDEIPAENVVDAVVGKVPGYVRKIMTTRAGNRAFAKYNDPEKVKRWDWIAQGLGEVATKGSFLYSTSDPVMGYNASEAGFPFRNDRTLWEMCAGLVGQVRSCVCVCIHMHPHSRAGHTTFFYARPRRQTSPEEKKRSVASRGMQYGAGRRLSCPGCPAGV